MRLVFAAVLLGLLSHSDAGADADASCKRPPEVEAFAAALYAALAAYNGPEVTNNVTTPVKQASQEEYDLVYKYLHDHNLCDADFLAFRASRAIEKAADPLGLPKYWYKTTDEVAQFLYDHGILKCNNALELALNYLKYLKKAYGDLDKNKFRSHMESHVIGMLEWVTSLGFKLQDSAPDLVDYFEGEFGHGKDDGQCIKSSSKAEKPTV